MAGSCKTHIQGEFWQCSKKGHKKSTVTLLRIVIPYFLTEYFCISFFQRFTYCVDCKLLLAMVITFPDEAVRGVRRNANFQMSQIGRSVQLHCVKTRQKYKQTRGRHA